MRALLAIGALTAAVFTSGAAAAAPSVVIKDAVARVVVIPEDRADIKVEFLTTSAALPLEVETYAGGRTVVDGGLRRNRIYSCTDIGGKVRVGVRGIGQVGYDDIPQIVVRTPRDADVDASGAVFGSIGRTNSLEFGNAGCGDWTIGNVRGRFELSQAGSGEVRAGTAGSASVDVAGSGDINLGAVGGDLDVDIAGSGDVHVASISGDLSTSIAGSGDVRVDSGRARRMDVSIAGSGDVKFGGVADSLEASVMGSGDVSAARVTGEVRKSVMGSGEVSTGR
jgi:hypothetical protein